MAENKVVNKDIIVMNISKEINSKINDLCIKNDIDREFFITKALENQIAMTSQNPRLVEKMNKLCDEEGMSRMFFVTKALENYCKYLSEKNDKGE